MTEVPEHRPQGTPTEFIQGWIVECACGWTNEMAPARSAIEANTALEAHIAHGR
jgi:hypothetical protein